MTDLQLPRLRLLSRPRIDAPDMGPLAGVVFTLVAFFMSTSHFAPREPTVQIPTAHYAGCRMEPSGYAITITINQRNRVFFALDDPAYQALTIQAVAARHGIHFTTRQQQELQKLPYLGMDVRRLPEYFAASRLQRYAILKSGVPAKQLAEYVDAATELYCTQAEKPLFCHIRADERLPFAQFKRITNMLQQRNINRYQLNTYGLARPAEML